MASRKKAFQPKMREIDPPTENVESKTSGACPKCGKSIFWLEFSGKTYGGSYSFDKEHTLSFTCPNCHYIVYQLSFRINMNDLKITSWTVREEESTVETP